MASAAPNCESIGQDQVAALVVTYLPDSGLAERLSSLRTQFGRVALIDNGSPDEDLSAIAAELKQPGVSLQRNSMNLGIATALNQGMKLLADEGFGWVVTLDQDSEVRPGFLSSLLATLNAWPDRNEVALVGANRIEPNNDLAHRWLRPRRRFPFFERVGCREAAQGVTLVITSGTLTSVNAFKRLGGFQDELFIDLVDFEYCLRARQEGHAILVSCGAELIHKVGQQTRASITGITISSTHHSPLRRYYLFRNSVHLIRRYGRIHPHWLGYQLLALCEVLLGIVVSEADKWRKLRACLAGLRDGLSGKTGPATNSMIS